MTAPTLPSTVAPPGPDSRIEEIRVEISDVDEQILALVAHRSELSREVGALRMAAGGTRLSLARERAIVDQFTTALGAEGTALAMLLLRAGRGRL